MRYEKYDFKHSFLNASGTRRGDKLVVAEFGKLVGRYPKVVVKAVRTAGIPIMANATSKQLIDVVKRNIKKNPKLATHISTMIMASAEYDGFAYDNLFGKKKDGTQRGAWAKNLFKGNKNKTNPDGTPKQKGKFLSSIFGTKGEDGKRVGGWFTKKEGGSKFGNWLRGKKGKEIDGVVQERSGVGDWLQQNQEGIGSLATSLIGGLFGGGGTDTAQNNAENNEGGSGGGGNGGGGKTGGGNTMLYIGGAVVVAVIIFFVVRGRGKGKGKRK